MERVKLTSSEWNVLGCLWEQSPRTAMQIVSELERTVGWHRSTTITILHRMEAKERRMSHLWTGSRRRWPRPGAFWTGCTGAAWG